MVTYYKLAGYEYDTGLAVGKDKDPWTLEDLNGNVPFKLYLSTDSVPTDYLDITSIEHYSDYGFSVNDTTDYKFVRDAMKGHTEQTGENDVLGTVSDPAIISSPATDDAYIVGASPIGDFTGQEGKIAVWNGSSWDFRWKYEHGFVLSTPTEKQILTEHKIGTTAQRIATVGADNTVMLGIQYHERSVEARQVRMAYATGEVHSRLSPNGGIVMQDIITGANNMFITFVFFGVEGSLEDGPWDSPDDQIEGIADYIYGRSGTEFDGTGLLQKGWTPNGMTLSELCDKLYDILIKGEY